MANYNTLIEKNNVKIATSSALLSQPDYPNFNQSVTHPSSSLAILHASVQDLVPHQYPLDTVHISNQQLTHANFAYESIPMNIFQNLCSSSVKLFSDGIYRIVRENNGVINYVPALVKES